MTDVHWIFDNRINKEINTLVKAGYEVYYVAPADKSELQEYVVSHPDVHVVPIHRYENRRERMRKGVREAYKAALSTNADVYHFHDPELIKAGIWLKLRGKKVIYDVHENYVADILSKEWIPKFVRKIYSLGYLISEKLSNFLFDGIIIVVPDIIKRFNEKKTIILPNYPDLKLFIDDRNEEIDSSKSSFCIGYMGGILKKRNIEEIMKAVRIANKKSNKLSLLLIGPIEDEELKPVIKKALNLKGNSFIYIPRKPLSEAINIMKKCDAGIIVLKPLKNYLHSSPNKLFEYMALGLPIIASDFPTWHKVLDEAKCAVYVDPLNVNDISEKMLYLANNPEMAKEMGERGKKLVFKKYNWSVIEERLLKFYRRILKVDKE
jgi:glycosyltransferase involved in cell wall biosynthesis